MSENFFRSQWNSECLFSSGTPNTRGVAILFDKNLDYEIHNHISDPDGNYIIADISVEQNILTLVNLHGPNQDTPSFFDNIISTANTIGNTSLIICGDFNTIQDEKLDYSNYKHINNKKAHEKILDIKNTYSLFDPYRESHPNQRRYTWRKKSPVKQARLDYFLISESLLSSVNKSSIEESYRSDHSMIILDISFVKFQKGKPLLKHNNSLLHDITYLQVIKDKINDVKKQYAIPIYDLENIHKIPDSEIRFTINDQLFMETLLMEIRGDQYRTLAIEKKNRKKGKMNL